MMHISKELITPPDTLYHGTTHKALGAIMKDGLKPMRRQYVHLSVDTDTAVQVGRRRDSEPVILKIDAAKAYSDGVKFYKGNDKVVLADYALVGGVLAGRNYMPVVFVNGKAKNLKLSDSQKQFLSKRRSGTVYVLGGEGAVPNSQVNTILKEING